MEIHTLSVADIKFPVFKLRKYNKIRTNGLGQVFIESVYSTKMIDDLSVKSKSLYKRRLRIPKEERYKLNKVLFNLSQMLREKKAQIYIDMAGKIFKYKKGTKLYNVICKKIISVDIRDGKYVLKIEGIDIPFILENENLFNIYYVQIMHTPYGPIIYNLLEEEVPSCKRKI